jgi:DNA (cytosine-5)-methyltransferase 1
MAWNKPAPTITSGCTNPSKGRFLHPTQNRAITLREASLLQTFPKRYKFPTDKGKGDIALMIGNALPPKFIKMHSIGILNKLLKRGA